MNQRNITPVIAIVVGFIGLIGVGYMFWYTFQTTKTNKNTNVATNTAVVNNAVSNTNDALLGGDADEHGCIGSAGYTWCELKNKCLRTWEEACIATNTNVSTNVNTPTTNTNATAKIGVKSYSSTNLGLTFSYIGTIAANGTAGEKSILVKETADTIYVYMTGTEPEAGQFVRAFTKTAGTTLKTAIEQQFLAGYNASDCYVETASISGLGNAWSTAQISYPPAEADAENFWANADKCPKHYTTSNGISYFTANSGLPTKFYYFSIGSYIIPAGDPDIGWEKTVEIVN